MHWSGLYFLGCDTISSMTIGSRSLAVAIFFCAIVLSLPLFVHAGAQADAMCQPVFVNCPCGTVPPKCTGGVNWHDCPGYCKDTEPGGVTSGHCVMPNVCHGDSTSGGAGQKGGGLDSALSQLGQLLGQLMKGGGSGGGDSPPPTTPTTPLTGCQGTPFQTSDVSQLSNPCAQYVPPTTNPVNFTTPTSTTCDALTQALGGCTSGTPVNCPPVAVDCGPGYESTAQIGVDANNCPLPNQCVLPGGATSTGTQNNNGVSSILCSASARLIGLCGGPNLSGRHELGPPERHDRQYFPAGQRGDRHGKFD
jgi:hypothetical protein